LGLTEVTLYANSPNVGKRVKELHLGGDALIVYVSRSGKLRIVRGGTILHAGDHVTIFAERPKSEFLGNYINSTLDDTELPEKTHVFHHEFKIPPESSIDGKKSVIWIFLKIVFWYKLFVTVKLFFRAATLSCMLETKLKFLVWKIN
jgi:NhaP-type Na+/H+ and K+/H+ antiporter